MRKLVLAILSFSILLSVLVWYGCRKLDSYSSPIEVKVSASIQGRVVDELGKPVNNATIKSGTAATTTDINGGFHFTNIQLSKNAGYISVEKTGYFKGGRTIIPHEGVSNYMEVQLIPKTNRGNFSSSAGGNVNIQNGSSVNFTANSFINANTNGSYSGNVTVYGAWIDPTSSQLAAIMPGNLTGLNAGNQLRLLQTFGMVAVELEGSGGEKLQLASGKTATITMPIPASILATAPATIPLWYFDETNGLWREEGTATKQGTNYVGTVSHFSFWNCDVPNDYITLTMTLQNQNAQPLQHYKVKLTNTQNNSSAYGYTDSSGVVSGAVPPNVTLQMTVYDNCNNVIHTQNIGPFSSTTNIGIITITVSPPATVTITGNVNNCSLNPVTNGFVDVYLESLYYRTNINNGSFSITINRCSNNSAPAQIIATDLQGGQQSSPSVLTVTSGSYNAGIINACGTAINQYISYVLNGTNVNFLPPADTTYGNRNTTTSVTTVYGNTLQNGGTTSYHYTSFNFTGAAAPGNYNLNSLFLYLSPTAYSLSGTITANITEYGNPGQYIAGSFTGNVKDSSNNTIYPINCNFRVKRGN